ncbi:MAG: methyltransferase domain-containing protein [Candidatus Heimdallarchaeum aukensis]|uniref:Methyltransferase domain-containing protein n=1 Tax=Candidatus Heimdallarchaeum aukensis TaxID=2876573 RepID=A0A9Y1BKQ2_9ARCH|nr:MAG: methyltransferase domain-containing protein [Candidatus Heimdallarchaeum aukensis]
MRKKKFRVRRSYDETAEMYDRRYISIQNKKYLDIIKHFKIPSNEPILDVGAGTGLFSKFLEKQNQVISCDISFNMLKEGIKNNGLIFTIVCDSDALPIRRDSISIITCFSVIQNVPEPLNTINQFNLILKEGGKVILTALAKLFSLEKLHELTDNYCKVIDSWKLPIEDNAIVFHKPKKEKNSDNAIKD